MESSSSPSDHVGQTVGGRYILQRLIGVGGYSAVYEAAHTVTGRAVALKLLHPHLLLHREIIDRFLLEARSISNVKHEGIVQVLDAGVDEPTSVYIVLELLEGESMEATLQRTQTLPWPATALYCAHILDALAEAHRHKIIHRDIKPGNIFLAQTPDGATHARLLDFGVALVAHQKRITGAGMLLGTPEYMSPEQCLAAPVGPETDLWALGIVLWECLTGRTPFLAESATATLLRITSAPTPSIRDVLPELPAPLVAVIDRALDRDVEKRWHSADDMRDALLRLLRRHGGPEGVAAARMASRSNSRLSAIAGPRMPRRTPEPEVVDFSAVLGSQRGGGPGIPLAAVVSGGAGARLAAAMSDPLPGATAGSGSDPAKPRAPSPQQTLLDEAREGDEVFERASSRSPPPGRAPARTHRAGDASRRGRSSDAPLRKPIQQEFELPADGPPIEPPTAPVDSDDGFTLPDLTAEERAARSFTGERATFQLPPTQAVNTPRPATVQVAAAAGALLAIGGVMAALSRAPGVPPAPVTDSSMALEVRDATPATAPEFTLRETFALTPPSQRADDVAEFVRHAVAGINLGASQRVLASCVPAPGGGTLSVRATRAGAQQRLAGGLIACAGHDLGVVPDVTADGVEDVVALGAAPDTLVVVDSSTLHADRTVSVPGLRGIAVGAAVIVQGEPVVVTFVEPAGPAQPTEIRAIGVRSLRELWRRVGEGSRPRLGEPDALGLAVGPDANGDGIGDIVAGSSVVVGAAGDNRCVELLSGADGRPLWRAPFCRPIQHESQSLSLGSDVNADGVSDVVVGTDHPPASESPVVILSGADGSLLRRIPSPPGASGFGAAVALGGDVDGDRRPDLVVSAAAAVHFFDATTGEPRGQVALSGAIGAPTRVLVVPPLLAESGPGVVVGAVPEGVRVFAQAGAAP